MKKIKKKKNIMVKGKNRVQAKISKLFMTKFGDTYLDWSKFWNQF